MSSGIGTLNEGSLHATIKELIAQPGDQFEVPVGRFVVDVVREDLLIEIQTGSFRAMGKKLDELLVGHSIHVVHPIALQTRLMREGRKPRRSPKRGSVFQVFEELVSIPTLLDHPNFTLELFLVHQNKHQVADARMRRRRGGWRTVDRSLDSVQGRQRFDCPADLLPLLPPSLDELWTTADLALAAGIPRRLAQMCAYCLRANELIVEEARTRAGIHYRRPDDG